MKPDTAIALVEKYILYIFRVQREELERRKQLGLSLETNYKTPTFYIFKELFIWKFTLIGILTFADRAVSIGSVYLLDLVTDSIKNYNQESENIGKSIFFLLLMTLVYTFGTYIESISNNY